MASQKSVIGVSKLSRVCCYHGLTVWQSHNFQLLVQYLAKMKSKTDVA